MKRLAAWVGIGAAALAVLILAAILSLPYFLDLPRVQALAAANASQALGRPVRFASVSVRLLPVPRVELHGLEIAEDPRFGVEPFVTLERGFLSLRLRALLGGRFEFGALRLERPLIRLAVDADGRLNIASLGVVKQVAASSRAGPAGRESQARGAAAGAHLLAGGIAVEQGTVIFASPGAGARGYRLVDLDLRVQGAGPAVHVAGRGTVVPGNASIRLIDGVLAVSGARTLADAPFRGQLRVESEDLGPLVSVLAPPEVGVTGRLQSALSIEGALASPRASGPVTISGAVLRRRSPQCRPPERTLAVQGLTLTAHWAERTLLGPLEARVAQGRVAARATLTLDRGLRVTLSDVRVHGLSLEPLLVDFLCDGYAVTGPLDLSASLAVSTPDVLGSASGEGRFSIGRGRVVGPRALRLFRDVVAAVDRVASAAGGERPSPFEFESIAGSYRIRDGIVTARDVLYTGRSFTVTASGDYGLGTDALDVDLVFRQRREQMRARVSGTSAAPVLRVDVLGSMRDRESQTLERGLRDLLRRFQGP